MIGSPVRCARYRVFTAGLADGERSSVPWRARIHIRRCPACRAELSTQLAVAQRLRHAAGLPRPLGIPRRRRPSRVGILVGGGGSAGVFVAAWLAIGALQDRVPPAITAAAQPPSLHATDAGSVERWCVANAGVAPPVVSVPTLQIEGARTDQIGGASAVTLYYRESGGERMTVTWVELTAAQPGSVQVERRSIAGHTALIVHDNADTGVVTGDLPQAELSRVAGLVAAEMRAAAR